MGANDTKCVVCQQNCEAQWKGALNDTLFYKCDNCGSFEITEQAIEELRQPPIAKQLFKIAAFLRERAITNQPKVTIVTSRKNVGEIKGAVVGIDDVLIAFPKTVSERLDRALKNVYRLSEHPGKTIKLTPTQDYPVFFAENKEVSRFIIETLKEQGWIKDGPEQSSIALTFRGWNRIADLEREKGRMDSKQAFVAMWFDEHLESAYSEGFAKAIKAAGYEPLRVDLKEHNEKIDDAIIAEIRKSRFMVADFTDHRGGVYYEAGFAKGLGMEVIWTCRENDIDKSHFDTRQYNHILWKDEQDLFEKLRRRIEATIPTG
jgi:nucleoside 2-deoxyribosyltransferase